MALVLVPSDEDLVIVTEEQCIECTDRKLGVLKRLQTFSIDPKERVREINAILAATHVNRVEVEKAWVSEFARRKLDPTNTKPTKLFEWLPIRRVRSRCDCGKFTV